VSSSAERPIVFYDGVCALCNRFVEALLRADVQGVLRFAPLQGQTASELLPDRSDDPGIWSVAYLDERGLLVASDAALAVCDRLGGAWRFIAVARIVPRPLRDLVYRAIARRRYAWFGRRDACDVRHVQDPERFLP
jgi:predicted DCC family thiol-disulfide oxidoreductase YuxK